jgi:tetratricopeptide (TPR) repeat protein
MRIKPRRRLLLLVAVVLVVAVAVFALVFVRGWQRSRMLDQSFGQARQALDQKHYFDALGASANYLNRSSRSAAERATPRYADALKIYAQSRYRVEESDQAHVRNASGKYREYLEYRPDDLEVRRKLVELLNECGMYVEAIDLAPSARPKDLAAATAADVPVLRQEAMAYFKATKFNDREPAAAKTNLDSVLDRLLELAPMDTVGHLLRCETLLETVGRDAPRIYAEELLAAHPRDPVAQLVAGHAIRLEGNASRLGLATELIKGAAGVSVDPEIKATLPDKSKQAPYPDEEFALQLIAELTGLGEHDATRIVIDKASDQFKSPFFERLRIRRMWQDGKNEELLARFAAIEPSSPDADPELLGFKAMAYQRLEKPAEADAIVKALKANNLGFRSASWAEAIPLMARTSAVKPLDAAAAWKEITKTHPYEPVFFVYSGENLATLGRPEEARQQWKEAAQFPLAASWPLPLLRIAETLVAEGRGNEALSAARAAAQIAPNRPLVAVVVFEAAAASMQRNPESALDAATLLRDLESVHQALSDPGQQGQAELVRSLRDRLLVPRVTFLCRLGSTNEAKQVALAAIQAEPPPGLETLQRLAAFSAEQKLGVEDAAMKRAESSAGAAPSIAFLKAAELAEAGKVDEGIRLLEAAAAANPGDTGAKLALARFLDRTGRLEDIPRATRVWAELAKANPSDLNIHRACLLSSSIASDPKLVEQLIAQYAKLIGSEPGAADVIAFTAKARALMYGTPSKSDRDKAIAILGAVVAAQPTLVEPKVLLAAALAYERSEADIKADLSRAISLLAEATVLDPSPQIQLELARLYQMQTDFARSATMLTAIARKASNPAQVRIAAAALLLAQNDPSTTATDVLAEVVKSQGATIPLLLTLGDGYLKQQKDNEARGVFDQVLAKLESENLPAGEKDYITARILRQRGELAKSSEAFERAVAAAPARAEIWKDYLKVFLNQASAAMQTSESYKRAGNEAEAATYAARAREAGDKALSIAKRAAAANSGDRELAVLLRQAEALREGNSATSIAALRAAIADDPNRAGLAEAIAAVESALPESGSASVTTLSSIADRYPTFSLIQIFLARQIAPRDPDRATVLLNRAMAQNPNDPVPAKAATEIFAELGRTPQMLAAALEWQRRDTSRPPEADVAVAIAYLRSAPTNPAAVENGLKVLDRHVQPALADLSDWLAIDILETRAELLLLANREPDARQLLTPTLSAGKSWRIGTWLRLAATKTPTIQVARQWMDALKAAIPADAYEEQAAFAVGLMQIGGRFRGEGASLTAEGIAKLEALTASPDTTTAVALENLGMVRQFMRQDEEAAVLYRKALAADPDRPIALNNLANIVLEKENRPDAALELAIKAVGIAPRPDNLNTLGTVYSVLGQQKRDAKDYSGARAHFKLAAEAFAGAYAQAQNPDDLVAAAQFFDSADDLARAAEAYELLLRLPLENLPEEQRSQLQANLPTFKNNLAACLVANLPEQDRAPVLARAAALMQDALNASKAPGFYDTAGWIELESGRLDTAAESFKTAMSTASKLTPIRSAIIGLATVHAMNSASDPAARAEAVRLLDSLQDVSDLPPHDVARLNRARDLVAKR